MSPPPQHTTLVSSRSSTDKPDDWVTAELKHTAPYPARGRFADGFEPLARCFAEQLQSQETGAGLAVYQRGRLVADLWGGEADRSSARPWQRDTRIVVFSVTKGLAAMAMNMLVERHGLQWDTPVAEVWPGFAKHGKEAITLRMLLNHRGGLPYLDAALTLADCTEPAQCDKVLRALELQRPAWTPGRDQGYHALTYGLYVRELFQRIAGEPLEDFLHRELLGPLGSDARLGTPASEDSKVATLYPPSTGRRLLNIAGLALTSPGAPETLIARSVLQRDSVARRAFASPSAGKRGVQAYNDVPVRRAALAWASATASADGLARAYLPFAADGSYAGRRYLEETSLRALQSRQSWAQRDRVLHKPLGWSLGFLKEERHMFSPNPESFGHPGLGGALAWCDPIAQVTVGYVMNRLDWRVRSPRALALCHALYECEPLMSREEPSSS